MTRTLRRPGTTLMEVLIATGILAVGMLAILALFPIGAVNMARSINQNRASDHAANSDALFRLYWKNAWIDRQNAGGLRPLDGYTVIVPPPNVPPNTQFIPGASDIEPMMKWLDSIPDPNTGAPVRIISTSSAQPSFYVMVDPVGFRTQLQISAANQIYIAGQLPLTNPPFTPQMPSRRTLGATPTATLDPFPLRATVRNTTMPDEFSYDGNGEPSALSGQLDRGGRYNVAWFLQRPKNNIPHEVHLQVLVFAGRSPTDTAATEEVFGAFATDYSPTIDPKPKSLTVLVNGAKPALMKGKWIGFTTTVQPQPLRPTNAPFTDPRGVPYRAFDFYRIAAVEEVDANTVTVELEEPLRSYGGNVPDALTLQNILPQWVPTSANPPIGTLTGQVVVFDTLFEVFDRGLVSASTISGQ